MKISVRRSPFAVHRSPFGGAACGAAIRASGLVHDPGRLNSFIGSEAGRFS
jgi:hypothetical protein